jgi:hypothetical protein
MNSRATPGNLFIRPPVEHTALLASAKVVATLPC